MDVFCICTQAGGRDESRREGNIYSLRDPGVFAHLYIPEFTYVAYSEPTVSRGGTVRWVNREVQSSRLGPTKKGESRLTDPSATCPKAKGDSLEKGQIKKRRTKLDARAKQVHCATIENSPPLYIFYWSFPLFYPTDHIHIVPYQVCN